jgi:hypothetical protein
MSYSRIVLTEDINLSWAYPFTGGFIASEINDVVADIVDHTISLPNSKLVPLGTTLLFNNVGSVAFTLLDYDKAPVPVYQDILPGEIRQIYLTNSDTEAGTWRIIPYGGGVAAINRIDFQSPTNTVVISPTSVVSPSGNLSFDVSESLQNLNSLTNNTNLGFAVITKSDPLEWRTSWVIGGENITVDDIEGVTGATTVNLNSELSAITSLAVGDFVVTGNTITTSVTDGNLLINSQGTGNVSINNVLVDGDSNVSNINNLAVTGSITSPAVASAQCFFFDNNTPTNNIIVQNSYNVASVTGSNGLYVITFDTAFLDGNYTVLLSLSRGDESVAPFTAFVRSRSSESVIIYTVDTLGNLLPALDGVSLVVFNN